MSSHLNAFCRLLVTALLVFAAQSIMVQGSAQANFSGKRIALVIGNGKYPTAPLKNPVNDARAMAKSLKELGFEVTLRENSSQRDLAAAVRQFGSSITPGSAAVFYFAGHGMQVKGRNYLVPVDADIQLEDEVPYSTIDVSLVLDKMEVGKSAVNIVILDACRNNPFARRFRSSGTGLAQMDAPIGTLIAFATAPGSVAQDGTGENGIYTKHLLDSIAMPGLPVEQMFKRVRVGVARDTNEAQVPWESSSMKGDFVFREAVPQQAASQDKLIEEAVRAAAERAAALTAERMAREQAARQPQNDKARAEQEALAAERVRLLRERERLAAENEALRRQAAQAPTPVALAAPTPAAQLPAAAPKTAGGNRPAVGDRWTYRYSDGYGKKGTFTARITAATESSITDEVVIGRSKLSANFEHGMEWASRNLDGYPLREISPYLLSLGPAEPTEAWGNVALGGNAFTARPAGTEIIAVPAGSFEARKIVLKGEQVYLGSRTRPLTVTIWYSPSVKRYVKMSFHSEDKWGGGGDRDEIVLIETGFPVSAGISSALSGSPGKSATAFASLAPAGGSAAAAGLPKVGDTWTYRFYDIYGKSETFMVQVTAASTGEVTDEARLGKARHAASFEPGLELADRKLGNLALREVSPYLLSHGPLRDKPEWKSLKIFDSNPPFTARLAGKETITVPAGSFEAEKLVIEGHRYQWANNPSGGSYPYNVTVWYAPAAKRYVKISIHGRNDNETIELTGMKLD
jgi:uncharacterized caspase-like protein